LFLVKGSDGLEHYEKVRRGNRGSLIFREVILIYSIFLFLTYPAPGGLPGEREHATALMTACRHLPAPLLSTPGERAGMLVEAARTLERIGDVKRLQDCYSLMKVFGSSSGAE
jgi:hypothetical protein